MQFIFLLVQFSQRHYKFHVYTQKDIRDKISGFLRKGIFPAGVNHRYNSDIRILPALFVQLYKRVFLHGRRGKRIQFRAGINSIRTAQFYVQEYNIFFTLIGKVRHLLMRYFHLQRNKRQLRMKRSQ